jgi:hypothetical protein
MVAISSYRTVTPCASPDDLKRPRNPARFRRVKDDPWAMLERILAAQGGRKTRDGAIVHCLIPANHNHGDRRPSLRLAVKNERLLMFCDICGRNAGLIEAARERGLWHSASPSRSRDVAPAKPFQWLDHLTSETLPIPECCLDAVPCEHRRKFAFDYALAFLTGELTAAAAEIAALYEQHVLEPSTLQRELELAIEVGGVGTAGFDRKTIARVIALLVAEWGGGHAG